MSYLPLFPLSLFILSPFLFTSLLPLTLPSTLHNSFFSSFLPCVLLFGSSSFLSFSFIPTFLLSSNPWLDVFGYFLYLLFLILYYVKSGTCIELDILFQPGLSNILHEDEGTDRFAGARQHRRQIRGGLVVTATLQGHLGRQKNFRTLLNNSITYGFKRIRVVDMWPARVIAVSSCFTNVTRLTFEFSGSNELSYF